MCFSFLLYSIYYELKTSQLFYDGFICFICCIGCTYFAYLSTQRHLDLSYLHKADYSIVSEMNRGRIPIPVILYSILPLIATSTGMTIRTAKFAVLYNIFTFLIIAYNISNITGICIDKSCHSIDKQQRDINFHLDLILSSILMSLSWFCCLPAAEIGDNFIRTKEIDAKADAMLSNILKNSIAGASCLIEIEQEEMKANPCEKCGIRHRLTQARHQLLHSMRWCTSRQIMVELAAGTYETIPTDVSIPSFLEDIKSMSENCVIEYDEHINSQYNVKVDESMARIAVENALANALYHGSEHNVTIKAETLNEGQILSFTIMNSKRSHNKAHKLSDSKFNTFLQSQVNIAYESLKQTNALSLGTVGSAGGIHRVGMAVTRGGGTFSLHYDQILRLVILNMQFPTHVISLADNDRQNSVFSNTKNEDTSLSSSVSSFFQTPPPPPPPPSVSSVSSNDISTQQLLSYKKNFSKKNSSTERKITPLKSEGSDIEDGGDHGGANGGGTVILKRKPSCSSPHYYSTTSSSSNEQEQEEEDDDDDEEEEVNDDDDKKKKEENEKIAKPSSRLHKRIRSKDSEEDKTNINHFHFPSNLKVYAIDDSKIICKGYERLLLPLLKCDSKSSLVTCPKSNDDVDEFMTYIKTKVNPINIVIFDQNIDLNLVNDGATTILGTDLAKELKDNHFKGLVVIRSANSSSSDFDQYMSTGVVDFCVGKSESHKDLASRIQNAYISKNMISH
mmetsp:Transcript_731/g.909  ORF Transcript_731/g.909 Transcript_731/m.909 type:complete len:734 (+) Transcript_731:145-2346(+)